MLPEFSNTEIAFKYRSNRELKQARFLFSSMGSSALTSIGMKLTQLAISWNLPVQGIIKSTLFNQFCKIILRCVFSFLTLEQPAYPRRQSMIVASELISWFLNEGKAYL